MSSPKPLSIVLVSGGMDSCVTAAIASKSHDLAMLHLMYGQRTQEKERQCFEKLADHFKARHRRVVDLAYLGAIGGSSLTDRSIEVTHADPATLFNPVKDRIPTSYVPFRNATFLSIATSWAEVLGAHKIFIGAVEEDSSGYPDCRREFYDAYQKVIDLGTKPGTSIQIDTPVIHLSKAGIVELGKRLGAPFEMTWSCYKDVDRACGECDSCVLRLRAFRTAGVEDPIPYRLQSAKR